MKRTDKHRVAGGYEDMIDLPHHVSKNHPQMSIWDRSAQFSPFAALTGHEDAIKETGRLTDEFVELGDDAKDILNRKLCALLERLDEHPKITVIYFVDDKKKTGGKYVELTGKLTKMNSSAQTILVDGKEIHISKIHDVII